MDNWLQLLPLAFIVAFFAWRSWSAYRLRTQAAPAWLEANAQFVDVRTPGEYQAGHNPKAVNIPLDTLQQRAGELEKDRLVVLVCRSGGRAGMATGMLRQLGFEQVENGGSWKNVP